MCSRLPAPGQLSYLSRASRILIPVLGLLKLKFTFPTAPLRNLLTFDGKLDTWDSDLGLRAQLTSRPLTLWHSLFCVSCGLSGTLGSNSAVFCRTAKWDGGGGYALALSDLHPPGGGARSKSTLNILPNADPEKGSQGRFGVLCLPTVPLPLLLTSLFFIIPSPLCPIFHHPSPPKEEEGTLPPRPLKVSAFTPGGIIESGSFKRNSFPIALHILLADSKPCLS